MDNSKVRHVVPPCSAGGIALVSLAALTVGPVVNVVFVALAMVTIAAGLWFICARRASSQRCAERGAARSGSVEDAQPGSEIERFLEREFAAARRGRDVTLVMFGFRRFDEFTRREGSAAAARALREFGDVLQRMTRRMNLTAQCGWRADAFLSVLSDADAAAAEAFIRRVREAAAAVGTTIPEVHVGIASYTPEIADPADFIRRAEHALDAERSTMRAAVSPPVPRAAWPRNVRAARPV